jgi:hexokinase
MEQLLEKYKNLFTLTPQRMRMIVDAFEETLDRGLQKWDQVIVSVPNGSLTSISLTI